MYIYGKFKAFNKLRYIYQKILLFIVLYPVTLTLAEASKLSFNPSVSNTIIQNWDNGDDTQPGGFVSLKPNLLVSYNGKVASSALNLGVEQLVSSNTKETAVTPQMSFSTSVDVNNRYSFNFKSNASRRIRNGPFTSDSEALDLENNNIVYNFLARQSYRQRLSSSALFNLQHSYSNSQSTLATDTGSQTHAAEIENLLLLSSKGTHVRLSGLYQLTDFNNEEVAYTGELLAVVVHPLRRTLSVSTGVGRDWVRLSNADLQIQTEIWQVGLNWDVSPRLSTTIRYGERFFGSAPAVIVKYSARRSGVELNWSRSLQLLQSAGIPPQSDKESSGNVDVSDSELEFIGLAPTSSFLDESKLVNETVSLAAYFNASKTQFTSTYSYLQSMEYAQQEEATFHSLRFEASRNLSRSVRGRIGLTFSTRKLNDESGVETNDKDQQFRATIIWSI